MCFYWKLKNALFQNMFLTLKLFGKMISKSTQNTEFLDFSFGKLFWCFRKKLYCFEEDLWWNTVQNPPFIQYCSKLNTGDPLEFR